MLTYLNDYPMIQTKLQAVCLLIEERLQIENTEIRKALIDLTNAGGGNFSDPLFSSYLPS